MSKVGNYIVGASVVAIMAGSPMEAEAHNNYGDDNTSDKDKVVYVEENLRDTLKNDSIIAWEMLASNEQELNNTTLSNQSKEELKEELKEDSWRGYGTIREVGRAPRIDNLQYKNKTIKDGERASFFDRIDAEAYYSLGSNTITDNIFEGQEQSIESTLSVLAHEAEHMHQHEKVNFSADMSLEQHYKLCCYKEIGAQVAGLLQLREMYKEAQTDEEKANILKEGKKEGYEDYFSKLENGEINPLSDKKEDFDKEMSVIVNSVADSWMNFKSSVYDKAHVDGALENARKGNVLPNDENYKKGVSLILTMGGIDFSQYLNGDIACYNKSIIDADKRIQNGEYFENVSSNVMEKDKYLSLYDDGDLKGFNLEQQFNLLLQRALVEKITKDGGDCYWADMVLKDCFFDKDYFLEEIKNISENTNMFEKSMELCERLAENKGNIGRASDKEYQEKLREIWTVENSKGEKVCLLDGIEEVPDLSGYVCSSAMLKQLDNRPFLGKVKDFIQNNRENNSDERAVQQGETGISIDIRNTTPLHRPMYERDSMFASDPSTFVLMTTSDIIDTRTDYLAQEREGRIEQAKQMLNEDLRNIHPKTETVDLNRQRLNDELSSIQPKTEKVNTGSEVLIALAQQGRGM